MVCPLNGILFGHPGSKKGKTYIYICRKGKKGSQNYIAIIPKSVSSSGLE